MNIMDGWLLSGIWAICRLNANSFSINVQKIRDFSLLIPRSRAFQNFIGSLVLPLPIFRHIIAKNLLFQNMECGYPNSDLYIFINL